MKWRLMQEAGADGGDAGGAGESGGQGAAAEGGGQSGISTKPNGEGSNLFDAAGNQGEGQQTPGEGGANGEWYLSEGVKGEGEPPEWFKGSKYKTVEEQAKAYSELEKRLGGFTGAPEGGPESYEVQLPEEVKAKGVDIDANDPLFTEVAKVAHELGMSNEAFNKLVATYASMEAETYGTNLAEEMRALGPNAQRRLSDLNDFAKANMNEDVYNAFKGLATSAQAIEVMESLRRASREPNAAQGPAQGRAQYTASELQAMQFAKDENGNRKMAVDPEYRRMVEEAYRKAYGSQPAENVVR